MSILTWNGTQDTAHLLSGLDRARADSIDFFVLDNGSTVDARPELQSKFPDVEIHRVDKNLGFTGGHNLVMKLAMERGYDAIAILNNDCEIDIDSIIALQDAMRSDPHVAAVSSLIYTLGSERKPSVVGGSIDWASSRSNRPSSPDYSPPSGQPMLIAGTSLLLRRSALDTIGLLDDRYFAYYDDNDLSARLSEAGMKAVYCRDSICLHQYRDVHHPSAMALYLSSRNQWLFWKTHTPEKYRPGIHRRLIVASLMDIAQLQGRAASAEKIDAVVDGFWDGIRKRFGPPPAVRSSPRLLRKIALAKPYFLAQLIRNPLSAIVGAWRKMLRQ